MENNAKNRRNIGLAAIGILVALILIFGERSRHDEKIAQDKQKAAAAKVDTPAPALQKIEGPSPTQLAIMQQQLAANSDKDDTDESLYVTGYGRMQRELAAVSDPAGKSSLEVTGGSGLAKDQVSPALGQAAKLQETQPGRYRSSQMTADGHIFGIDTTTGGVWRLASGAEKWEPIGKPANATPGAKGTYFITACASRQVTIMNADNAFTWRATLNLSTGKWDWKELGGFPDDSSWKLPPTTPQ